MLRRYGPWAFAALVIALPWLVGNPYFVVVLVLGLANALAVWSLSFLIGYTGNASLGQAGFVAVGAYAAVILGAKLGLPFPLALLGAVLVTGLIGFLMGLPSLRLEGPYLAVVTLAFGTAVRELANDMTGLTGGSQGLKAPQLSIGIPLTQAWQQYYLVAAILAGAWILSRNVMRSYVGRALIGVRDIPIAASAMGVEVRSLKVFAFAFSGMLAGASGAILAYTNGYITPDDFGLWQSIFLIAAALIGGVGSFAGAIVGGFFITLIPQLTAGLPAAPSVVFGVLLLAVLFFASDGLVAGSKRWWRAAFDRG